MAQKTLMTSRPIRLYARGATRLASQLPMPVSLMMPISTAMKAMNGRMLRMILSISSLPAW